MSRSHSIAGSCFLDLVTRTRTPYQKALNLNWLPKYTEGVFMLTNSALTS